MLCIYAAERSLILVDGSPVGEADAKSPAAFPLPPDCAHYLTALPLQGALPPVTRRAAFAGGELASLSGEAAVYAWEDCTELVLPAPPKPFVPQPSALLCDAAFGPFHAVLFYECGAFLALDEDERTLLSLPLGEERAGELYVMGNALAAFAGPRCVLVSQDGPRVLLELSGGSFAAAGETLVHTQELSTVRRHRQTDSYAPDGSLIAHVLEPSFAPQSGSEAFLALLEALQLGAQNEAAALLSGELSGLTDAQLKDFFGPYQSVRPHPFRPDVAGAVPPGERRVRAFSFAASDASGAWQVTNAQEL